MCLGCVLAGRRKRKRVREKEREREGRVVRQVFEETADKSEHVCACECVVAFASERECVSV